MDSTADFTTPSRWKHHADATIAIAAVLVQERQQTEPMKAEDIAAIAGKASRIADALAIEAWRKTQVDERKLFQTVSAWANATPLATSGEGRYYVQLILKYKHIELSEKFAEAERQIDSMGIGEFLKALNHQIDGDQHAPDKAKALAAQALMKAWN
jgi:hypothetical protein